MFFTLSKVFWFLANPGNLLLILICLGVALLWTRWPRAGRRLLTATAVIAVILSVAPLGSWLVATLEDRFPPPVEMPARVDGIIVLGGMINPALSEARGQTALGGAVERLTAFARLAKRYPRAKLVFTAGSGDIFRPDLKEADFVGPVLAQLGLDPARVLFEDQSRNTFENAAFSYRLARPEAKETWLLITSAFHMPRAVGSFRRIGWNVAPYPVDYQTGGKLSLEFSFIGGLSRLGAGLHEFIGLAFYWLTDKTGSLFPGP